MTKRRMVAIVGLILLATGGGSEAFVQVWYRSPKTAALVVNPIEGRWFPEVQKAASAWNSAGSQFSFTTRLESSFSSLCARDGINSIGFRQTHCNGQRLGPRVLAATLSHVLPTGQSIESDILFNIDLPWAAYDGPYRDSPKDFRRVLLHELGHVLGLDHPDEYGQTQPAIMQSFISHLFTLQPDDFAGIQAIYGRKQSAPAPAPRPVPAPRPAPRFFLENPHANAFKSGIGLISGWVCRARTVEVRIDNQPKMRLVYGTPRSDTRAVCGDINTGFGTLVNWNLFGNGAHTLRLYVDGRAVRAVRFTVTTLGEEFVRGLQGSYIVPDFPRVGRETSIRWEESSQNFVIDGMR